MIQRLFSLLILLYFTTIVGLGGDLFGQQQPSDSLTTLPKIEVMFFISDECTISRYYAPHFKNWFEKYQDSTTYFTAYFPNFSSKKEQILQFQEEFKIPFALKTDYFKKQTLKYDIKVVPEVVVLYNKQVIYKGRIDNSYYRIGKRRRITTSYDLLDILDTLKQGKIPKFTETTAIGCFINYTENKI